MGRFSNFLFSDFSFMDGLSRTLDIGSTFVTYNTSNSEEEADVIALNADWNAVGETLCEAMNEYRAR